VGGHRQSDQEGQGCIPRIDPIGESEADLQPKDRPPISPILTCLSETNSFVIGH